MNIKEISRIKRSELYCSPDYVLTTLEGSRVYAEAIQYARFCYRNKRYEIMGYFDGLVWKVSHLENLSGCDKCDAIRCACFLKEESEIFRYVMYGI